MDMSDTQIDLATLTGSYTIDPTHSRFGFVARHAMVTKVRGSFNEFEAEVHLDGEDPSRSRGRIVIQAASVDTRNADRDAHLKSNDFFAMEQFPTITFEAANVEPRGGDAYAVTGDLTIKDVTKPVTVDFEFTGAAKDPWGNTRVGLEGHVVINRKDWGVNFNAALETGGVLISEKVTLEIELSLVKDQ
jgi:polyisoprenoid-binding protein YceI